MGNDDTVIKMLEYCEKIQAYSKGVDEQQFYASSMITEASVFCFIQLGELVTQLDPKYMEKNPQIRWKVIKGFRNKLVHDYEGINMELLWNTIKNDLPDLIGKLNGLMQGNP